MNSPERALRRALANEDARANGEDERRARRKESLKRLKVKTIVRESDLKGITHCEYAHESARCENLFATCGESLVTIYDDEHFGDHVSAIAQYAHDGKVATVAWIRTPVSANDGQENALRTKGKIKAKGNAKTNASAWVHEFGDAALAVGDERGVIVVISVASNRVVARIDAHVGAVVDMSGAGANDGVLVSLGADGVMKVWNVFGGDDGEGECLGEYLAPAGVSVACKADGLGAITGHRGGEVMDWAFAKGGKPEKSSTLAFQTPFGRYDVDCVRVVNDVVYAKTVNMCFGTFDLSRKQPLKSWVVPNRESGKAASLTRTRFGVTSDGRFLACGDGSSSGVVYTYDALEGELVGELAPLRVTGIVRAAHVADHCRHVLASYGPGVLWRYEIIPDVDAVAAFAVDDDDD